MVSLYCWHHAHRESQTRGGSDFLREHLVGVVPCPAVKYDGNKILSHTCRLHKFVSPSRVQVVRFGSSYWCRCCRVWWQQDFSHTCRQNEFVSPSRVHQTIAGLNCKCNFEGNLNFHYCFKSEDPLLIYCIVLRTCKSEYRFEEHWLILQVITSPRKQQMKL